jgi:DUF4097 and DUF4098 domain-containing protein YvlB
MDRKHVSTFVAAALGGLILLAPAVRSETRIEREFDMSPGARFELDTSSGSVVVRGVSGSRARVVITSNRDDIETLYDFEWDVSDEGVKIDVDKKGRVSSWFSWTRGSGLHFEIDVPRQTEVDIDTAGGSIEVQEIEGRATLDTSGGAITARSIGGKVLADTSGGSIVIEDVDGDASADTSGGSVEISKVRGNVLADTSGGSIRIDDVSGDIRADTSGGGIRIRGAGGEVRADTSGGGVTVEFVAGNSAGGRISSSGGGVRVRIDPSVNLDVDASSSGGSVESDVPVTVEGRASRSTLRGRIGSGGALLHLRSSGGPVRIEPL